MVGSATISNVNRASVFHSYRRAACLRVRTAILIPIELPLPGCIRITCPVSPNHAKAVVK